MPCANSQNGDYDDPPDPALARALRRLREERGATQEDLAYEAGVTVATLARIERCQTDPHWTTIVSIADALEITLEELFNAIHMEMVPRDSDPPAAH